MGMSRASKSKYTPNLHRKQTTEYLIEAVPDFVQIGNISKLRERIEMAGYAYDTITLLSPTLFHSVAGKASIT